MHGPDAVTEARGWFDYSREDLDGARESSVTPRHACFFAQQAAEKAIKCLLVLEQLDVPRTHDLEALRELVPSGYELKRAELELELLSQWAVEVRYPGDQPPTDGDASAAVAAAERVVEVVSVDFERNAGE